MKSETSTQNILSEFHNLNSEFNWMLYNVLAIPDAQAGFVRQDESWRESCLTDINLMDAEKYLGIDFGDIHGPIRNFRDIAVLGIGVLCVVFCVYTSISTSHPLKIISTCMTF